MICDLETGVCGVAGEEEFKVIDLQKQQKKSIYIMSPIRFARIAGDWNLSCGVLKNSTDITLTSTR